MKKGEIIKLIFCILTIVILLTAVTMGILSFLLSDWLGILSGILFLVAIVLFFVLKTTTQKFDVKNSLYLNPDDDSDENKSDETEQPEENNNDTQIEK